MRHFSYFNCHIINPIKRYGYVGDGRKALTMLQEQVSCCLCELSNLYDGCVQVLGQINLRRTKEQKASEIKIPPCTVRIRKQVAARGL